MLAAFANLLTIKYANSNSQPPSLIKAYRTSVDMRGSRRAVSIPSHFPFRVHLAHCLLTRIDCVPEESWTYKREERKLEKELGNLQHRLNGIRAAAKALGG